MKKNQFLLLISIVYASTSYAQAPEIIGTITRVEGLSTISQGNALGNVFKDQNVLQNARVITTSTGITNIKLNNGCVLNLKPNQSVVVDNKVECKLLNAGIQTVGAIGIAGAGVGSAITAAIPIGLSSTLTLVGGLITGLIAVDAISNSNNNSALEALSGS